MNTTLSLLVVFTIQGLQQKDIPKEIITNKERSKDKLADLAVGGGDDGGALTSYNVVGEIEKGPLEQKAIVHMAREPQAPVEKNIYKWHKEVERDSDSERPAVATQKPVLRYDDTADVDKIYGR